MQRVPPSIDLGNGPAAPASEQGFTVEERGDLWIVTVDQPGRSVNAFSQSALAELEAVISRIGRASGLRGVLFRSGKPGVFIAGADIDEMRKIGSAAEARAFSQRGQRVFERLSQLQTPTVALISGSCLGGGLEFALACKYRIADDHRKTLLGLPEVKLGLVPGWGGTVRLPARVGLTTAIRMITTGETLNGRQAQRIGLVDAVVPTEALLSAGERLLDQPPRPRRRSWFTRTVLESRPANSLVFKQAKKLVLAKSHGHYPAPLRVIDVLSAGVLESPENGFNAESAAIADLAAHPVTTELFRLFFLREEAKKWAHEAAPDADDVAINSAGELGAGLMGAGIAAIMAERGIEVRLKDISAELLARGLRTIEKRFRDDVKRRRTTDHEAQRAFRRISPTVLYNGLRHADIVIEAAVESLDVKRQIFRDLEQACGPETVLATNTSSLSVAAIAESLTNPRRLVGVHFFNPPHKMPLVEVVRLADTNPRALAVALALVKKLGKTPVVLNDCPGFLVNRLLVPYLNEAGYLLAEVPDPMLIERAAIQFGFPMGPLELTDLVGAGVSAKVGQQLHEAYGDRMAPAPAWQRVLGAATPVKGSAGSAALITRSWRGKRRFNPEFRKALAELRRQHGATAAPSSEEMIRRMVYPIVNEAARCLEEGIVGRSEQIDLAMVFGAGFAPFRGGPLRYADEVGIAQIVETLTRWSATMPRMAPCELLRQMANSGRKFSTMFERE